MIRFDRQRPFRPVSILLSFFLVLLGVALLGSSPVQAGEVDGDRLTVSAPDTVTVTAGETATLSVSIDLDSGWHVNTNTPRQDYLIPTEVSLDADPLSVRAIHYPAGETYSFSFSAEELDVYSDTAVIDVTLEADGNRELLVLNRRLELTYQPCSDRQCLRPQTVTLPLDLRVVNGTANGERT